MLVGFSTSWALRERVPQFGAGVGEGLAGKGCHLSFSALKSVISHLRLEMARKKEKLSDTWFAKVDGDHCALEWQWPSQNTGALTTPTKKQQWDYWVGKDRRPQ